MDMQKNQKKKQAHHIAVFFLADLDKIIRCRELHEEVSE